MCKVCKMSLDNEEDVLAEIGKKIKSGTKPEHFAKLLDKLCGTELKERDEGVEAAWENSRNKKDG